MQLTSETIAYLLGLAGLLSIIFTVYNSFRNPQIKNNENGIKFREELDALKREVIEIKTSHLVTVEKNMTELSKNIHNLALNVTRLSTIIDERMPRQAK
jgi:hypothetical protein